MGRRNANSPTNAKPFSLAVIFSHFNYNRKMSLSSNTIIHFTKLRSSLIGILKEYIYFNEIPSIDLKKFEIINLGERKINDNVYKHKITFFLPIFLVDTYCANS